MMEQINVAEALQVELMTALQEAIPDYDEATATRVVAPLVHYLQRQYGGERLYIPKPYRLVDAEALRQAQQQGKSITAICANFGISRRTFYRLLES